MRHSHNYQGEQKLKIIFIRHGKTKGNLEKRYIGRTDEPLCSEGISEISERKYPPADIVISSPMKRCLQSAQIIYPEKEIIICPELQETDFGDFEGKNYSQLSEDIRYRRWIDGEYSSPPNGESRDDFIDRCCAGFSEMINKHMGKTAAFIVHGGTVMAIMSRFAYPEGGFYDFQVKNGGGYTAELSDGKIINYTEF